MSLKSYLKKSIISAVMAKRLSEKGIVSRREKTEKNRRKSGMGHKVRYFHQVDDPYSALTAMTLKPMLERYDIALKVFIVGQPEDAVAPQREKLAAWSRVDACSIAPRYGLSFADAKQNPDHEAINKTTAILVQAVENNSVLDVIEDVSNALWSGEMLPDLTSASAENCEKHLTTSASLRKKAGHYLGGIFCYGDECYWGLDRLHYLEERLCALGASRSPGEDILYPVPKAHRPTIVDTSPNPIDFFVSLRSPYSGIVAKRVFALGKRLNAEVRVRYVLPMVMRGLPVPREKALYIVHDTAREALRLGVPFGRINDPLGLPTERGLSLMPLAEEKGVVETYLVSFLEGVWAEGIDAGTDKGLRKITERVGLDWTHVQSALKDVSWREIAEANRAELSELGLWGVPSFHCGDAVLWGQDRMWALEEAV